MKIEHDVDVTRYVFRQSWLEEYFLCPERARLDMAGFTDSYDTAESAVGTATHKAVELYLGGLAPSDALEAAVELFRGLSGAASFRWVKLKTAVTAEQHITNCFNTWLRDIQPKLGDPWAIELPFKLLFAVDYKRELWLQGTIDYIDYAGVWDWKTCSRLSKFTIDGWQLKRWGVQASVYTWAARELGYIDAPVVPFTWAAMQRTPCASATLMTTRGRSDWDWLERQLWNVVTVASSNAMEWPLNDHHALCSEAWCPAWTMCKGKITAM